MTRIEQLKINLLAYNANFESQLSLTNDQLILEIEPENLLTIAQQLRDESSLRFEQLMDVCGVDYQQYGGERGWNGHRFAAVYQLLSVTHNWRLRLKVFAKDEKFPVIPSVISIWAGANWFEREAFDLYGIIFEGHPDLRRILTDYGFIGYPFRKDFPLSGNVEMRYDPKEGRVIYQPVSIEPREVTPRVVREPNYGVE